MYSLEGSFHGKKQLIVFRTNGLFKHPLNPTTPVTLLSAGLCHCYTLHMWDVLGRQPAPKCPCAVNICCFYTVSLSLFFRKLWVPAVIPQGSQSPGLAFPEGGDVTQHGHPIPSGDSILMLGGGVQNLLFLSLLNLKNL